LALHRQQWPHHAQDASLHQPLVNQESIHVRPPRFLHPLLLGAVVMPLDRSGTQSLENTEGCVAVISHGADEHVVEGGGDPVVSDIVHEGLFEEMYATMMDYDYDYMILLSIYLFLHVRQNHDPFLRPRDAVVAALAY